MARDELDVEAYLKRTRARRPLAPSAEALADLQQAHVGAIPFENLDILLGRPIALDLTSLQAKLVAARRGGYCFEHNTLFQAVLDRLGFDVTPLAARVRMGATAVLARTHMLLRVDLAEGPFVADVGFGRNAPVRSLPLEEKREHWLGPTGHRFRREDDLWVLEGNPDGEWIDLFAFTLEPQYPVDFEMANHFTSTHPGSAFVNNLTAQRLFPEGGTVLRNRELTVREGRTTETTTIRDPEHLLDVLEGHFDLAFPPGTRFSRPEF
ncbi:MAG: arylamine N-acetyltransferase [Acidobacteria bacterium]|jgi:N-hydroxyarylamine O-acetyltransferase|nr:arylamine N-acetyltransferase [Acidobacteriota bacterium]